MKANIVGMQEHQSKISKNGAGDLLLSYLEQIGVEYVFGIPGGAIEPLYDALARSERSGGLKSVVARHETGAAFMAEGYARNSEKLGVCCSTTGPGATNLITGVASAYENQTPMLVITAQTALKHFGKRAFQESADTGVNIVGMLQFCTHYNTMVTHVEQLEQKLVSAIMTALTPPCGPVHLSIPVDILKTELGYPNPRYDLNKLLKKPALHDDVAIESLCENLKSANKVVFVLGSGSRSAANIVLEVASAIDAYVVTTADGKGLISPYHPQFRGVIGFAGHRSASELLVSSEIDSVVAVGTNLGEWTSNGWDTNTLLNERLIHIDSAESNMVHTPMAKLHVRGNIASVFEALSQFVHKHMKVKKLPQIHHQVGLHGNERTKERDKVEQIQHFEMDDLRSFYEDMMPIRPQWLMHKLAQLFPSHTKYLADTGNSVAWAIHYLHPFDRRMNERRSYERRDSGRRNNHEALFQCSLEFASMGWAIGNAVGAALAYPGDPIVCITGDGSVLMNGQEMTVAKELKLPVIFIVLNDSELGMVKHGQLLGGAERIGYQLPRVNFAKLAQSMGITGYQIQTTDDLLELNIDALCSREGPTVLDVIVDSRQVPPMGVRIKVLQSSQD